MALAEAAADHAGGERGVMADVQVGNARRIGFTALALVAFWVMAWQAYQGGFVSIMLANLNALSNDTPRPGIPALRCATVTVAYATLPVLFLSLAAYNSPVRAGRSILIVVTSVLVAGTVASSFLVGVSDSRDSAESLWHAAAPLRRHIDQLVIGLASKAPPPVSGVTATVSWFLLLLPIILTTAFVIFGAWRRAVRDAEVDAVGEGE